MHYADKGSHEMLHSIPRGDYILMLFIQNQF